MTHDSPGPDDIPKPWDGRPPAHYRAYWDYDSDASDDDFEDYAPPPIGPNRRVVAGIAVAVVVVVTAGVSLWWFSVGPGKANATPQPVAATSSRAIRQHPAPAPSSTPSSASTSTRTTPDSAAAYDVGSCFNEQTGTGSGSVELNPVPCGGNDSVFVINSVVPALTACDSGPGSADFHDHGYEVPDETANVTYCASLVVPVNSCFVLGPGQPAQRATCGSAPDVVRVLAIESAPSAGTACTDKTNPDVWFYQAPNSGQYACVSRPPANGTSTPAPTSSG